MNKSNEHMCKLMPMMKNEETKMSKDMHKGKSFNVVSQKQKDGTMKQQAYKYPKDKWSADEAKSHCMRHKGMMFEPAMMDKEEIIPKEEMEFYVLCEEYGIEDNTINSIKESLQLLDKEVLVSKLQELRKLHPSDEDYISALKSLKGK